jgi:hypothetical protein
VAETEKTDKYGMKKYITTPIIRNGRRRRRRSH